MEWSWKIPWCVVHYAIPRTSENQIIRTRLSSLSVENRICDRRSYINGLLLINASSRRSEQCASNGGGYWISANRVIRSAPNPSVRYIPARAITRSRFINRHTILLITWHYAAAKCRTECRMTLLEPVEKHVVGRGMMCAIRWSDTTCYNSWNYEILDYMQRVELPRVQPNTSSGWSECYGTAVPFSACRRWIVIKTARIAPLVATVY